MTTEEKNEFYNRTLQRNIKGRKSMIISMIVLPLAGVAITLLLGVIGQSKEKEVAEATVLDSMSVGTFIDENESGSAIFTGEINAVDPVITLRENGEYMYFSHKIEQEMKIYDEEKKQYEVETDLIESDSDSVSEVAIDDVVLPYKIFHNLPIYTKTSSEGADINKFKTTFSYTPRRVEGTFFIKCKNHEASSVRYYESANVAGEINKGFGIARIIVWIFIVGIEIYLVISIFKASKAIKNVEGKIK